MRLIRIFLPALAAALGLGACGGAASGDSAGQIRVVATTPVAADLTRRVAGERAAVAALLAANTDPHGYEPRPSGAESVTEADLVIRSGGPLDEWMDDLVAAGGSRAPVLELIDSVQTITAEDRVDPHWWHDPANAVSAVRAIRDALARADPDGREAYARNALRYERRLRSLDAAIASCMESVPRERRKLVTTHDALGYFARRYGIEVIGSVVPSLSTEAQPSAGETAKLIDQIRREEVKAIFPESSVDSKVEEAIARESGARIGERLWADGLGPRGSRGETYVKSLAANAAAMVAGFTGGAETCELRV